MTDASAKLTGVWHGLYTYANGLSVSFVATVIENGSHVSGSTHEPCGLDELAASTLYATLVGQRQDSVVTFVKTYDGDRPGYLDPIAYDGTLSHDGTEIEGRWTISARHSGKFLMVRSTGKDAAIAREVLERA